MGAERTEDCFHTEAMTKEQPEYLSYLLRLRRVGSQEGLGASSERVAWRASLEDPHNGRLHNFASLEEAFDFLRAQMGAASEPATGRAGAPGRGAKS